MDNCGASTSTSAGDFLNRPRSERCSERAPQAECAGSIQVAHSLPTSQVRPAFGEEVRAACLATPLAPTG